jgi:hypothetical protein
MMLLREKVTVPAAPNADAVYWMVSDSENEAAVSGAYDDDEGGQVEGVVNEYGPVTEAGAVDGQGNSNVVNATVLLPSTLTLKSNEGLISVSVTTGEANTGAMVLVNPDNVGTGTGD